MRIFRLVGKAVLLFVVCFTLLAWPWESVRSGYSRAYQATGNLVFATFGSWGRVHFSPAQERNARLDTAIAVMNRRTGARARIHTNSRFMAYVPTVLVVSLIATTPVPWRQRGRALLLGLLLVNAFVLLRLALVVLQLFSGDGEVALFSPGPFWSAVLGAVFSLLVVSAAGAFVVPVLIWALVTFRKADWRRIMKTPPPKQS